MIILVQPLNNHFKLDQVNFWFKHTYNSVYYSVCQPLEHEGIKECDPLFSHNKILPLKKCILIVLKVAITSVSCSVLGPAI
jgi:hypothetical protein